MFTVDSNLWFRNKGYKLQYLFCGVLYKLLLVWPETQLLKTSIISLRSNMQIDKLMQLSEKIRKL